MKLQKKPKPKKEKVNLVLPDEKDEELFKKIKTMRKIMRAERIKRIACSFFVLVFIFSIGGTAVYAYDNAKENNNKTEVVSSVTATAEKKAIKEKVKTTKASTTKEAKTEITTTVPETTTVTTTTTTKPSTTTTKPSTTLKPTTTKKKTTTTKKITTKPYTTKYNPYAAIPAGGTAGLPLYDSNSYRDTFGNYLNKLRLSYGARVVANDTTMNKLAGVRAKEISQNFAHSRAGGQKGYSVYYSYNVPKPRCTAENIACAKEMYTAYELYEIWLNSPEHKKSMINNKYSKFGIATYTVGNITYGALLLAGD